MYRNYFEELLVADSIDFEVLRLLTANLFLNMLPLHIDNKERLTSLSIIGSFWWIKIQWGNYNMNYLITAAGKGSRFLKKGV